MKPTQFRPLASGLAALLAAFAIKPVHAAEPAHASPWASEHATRARLVAGQLKTGTGSGLVAGIEIEMDEGWKTYWRNPGSSGVPPRMEWTGSENVGKATLLFPAPYRLADREGDTFGYKSRVVLPVTIEPKDASAPVKLKLALEYGVCKEVCVPAQMELSLLVPALASARPGGSDLAAALERVPSVAPNLKPGDPRLASAKVDLDGSRPRIVLDVVASGPAAGTDIFLEAPEGLWIPLAKRMPSTDVGKMRFEVDLSDGADLKDLAGRMIRVTMVAPGGQSEASFKFE